MSGARDGTGRDAGAAAGAGSRARGSAWRAAALLASLVACGGVDGDDHPTRSAAPASRDASATSAPSAPPAGAAAPATLAAPPGAAPADPQRPALLCFGDSLTAGHGLPPDEAWPARLAGHVAARGWALDVVNAGVSGETSTGGLRRLEWVLRQHADVAAVVVALGGNDGLRGIPPDVMERNLGDMLATLAAQRPDAVVVLAGMESPPNMGAEYTAAFREVFPRLAERHGVTLLPFLLEGVAAEPALNQDDGIHPNAAGQEVVADHVWATLAPLLAARLEPAAGGGAR